MKGYKEFLDT